MEDFSIILNREQIEKLFEIQKINPPDGFYTFLRFCQFVVFIQYQPDLGYSIEITDYKDDLDAALDTYSLLRGKNWSQKDTDKIMKIFMEIQNTAESAEMVIKDPFQLP